MSNAGKYDKKHKRQQHDKKRRDKMDFCRVNSHAVAMGSHNVKYSTGKKSPSIDLLTVVGIIRAGMTRTEHTPGKEDWQDTAEAHIGHDQTPPPDIHPRREPPHDKRERTLYPSDLNKDILENPALYVGPADF